MEFSIIQVALVFVVTFIAAIDPARLTHTAGIKNPYR